MTLNLWEGSTNEEFEPGFIGIHCDLLRIFNIDNPVNQWFRVCLNGSIGDPQVIGDSDFFGYFLYHVDYRRHSWGIIRIIHIAASIDAAIFLFPILIGILEVFNKIINTDKNVNQ